MVEHDGWRSRDASLEYNHSYGATLCPSDVARSLSHKPARVARAIGQCSFCVIPPSIFQHFMFAFRSAPTVDCTEFATSHIHELCHTF